MLSYAVNPFNELYVTETIAPRHYVSLFSDMLVQSCLPIFQPGNVVVKGLQGSGKSMLLNLLKPEIRVAYHQAGARLPIPAQMSRFVGAGINLTHSAAADFGQRPIEEDEDDDAERAPVYFGDFVNYWVVDDILNSIHKLATACNGAVGLELGLSYSPDRLDAFAAKLATDPCWFGYLDGVASYADLRARLAERIGTYHRYLNYNIVRFPEGIRNSKTAIRVPMSQTVVALWDAGIVPCDVPVFVRIDQYEELSRLEDWNASRRASYRQVINKALGTRDPAVSFRIGTRRYAWEDDLRVYGSASALESERDYKQVDIEELLRRPENASTWIFPAFAADVFERRLAHVGFRLNVHGMSALRKVLGEGLSPSEKARTYAGGSAYRQRSAEAPMLRAWAPLLADLWAEDPLSAQLGEAWLLQAGRRGPVPDPAALSDKAWPWVTKQYWRKERIQQALMQLAARNAQRIAWGGTDEVLALSGSNILVFVSICQQIWAAWVRSTYGTREGSGPETELPSIPCDVQSVGIDLASTQWYEKIPEETDGHSRERQRFAAELGRWFRAQLVQDRAMSYPGHNGFSLAEDDLNDAADVLTAIRNAVDYGALVEVRHTTKLRDRKMRRKYYLNPVVSPHFQIPCVHVKEPIYTSASTVRALLHAWERAERQVGAGSSRSRNDGDAGGQLTLFAVDSEDGAL